MQKIKQILEDLGMSIYQLSKRTGIPYSTINDYCTGKKELSRCAAETLLKISSELHVPMEKLICDPDLNRRKEAIAVADAVNSIEGAPVSGYTVYLSELWSEGIITGSQLSQAVAYYQKSKYASGEE